MPHVLFHSQHPAGHETPISLQLAYSTYFVLCASVWENKERQKILSVCVCVCVCVCARARVRTSPHHPLFLTLLRAQSHTVTPEHRSIRMGHHTETPQIAALLSWCGFWNSGGSELMYTQEPHHTINLA